MYSPFLALPAGNAEEPAADSRAGRAVSVFEKLSTIQMVRDPVRRPMAGAPRHAAQAGGSGLAGADPHHTAPAAAAPHQILAIAHRWNEPAGLPSGAIAEQRERSRMKWLTLESKMLSAAAYDDSKQILYLRFRDTGHVYRYFDFPIANQQAFLSAESKGRFFRYLIRDRFRYERMAKLHAA
jgi:hypothetical protein